MLAGGKHARQALIAWLTFTWIAAAKVIDAAEPAPFVGKEAGLKTPESVLYDPQADLYIVSNINGTPLQKDGNGFLSQIAPDGKVVALKWVAGGQRGAVLDAPKGMGLKGEVLLVADIDVVRLFHRVTGAPMGVWSVPGAVFLNDIAVADDGTVFVSDTGFKATDTGFAPAGTDAIYRFDDKGTATALVRGAQLGGPNGLLPLGGGAVLACSFGSGAVYAVDAKGTLTEWAKPDGGQLDGIVRDAGGTIWVTGWEKSAVYAFTPGKGPDAKPTVRTAFEGLTTPADLGIDQRRGRLLIPLFTLDGLESRALPQAH